jgi:hypothetical protein
MDETTKLKLQASAAALVELLEDLFGEPCPFTLSVYVDEHLHVLGNMEIGESFRMLEDAVRLQNATIALAVPAPTTLQ